MKHIRTCFSALLAGIAISVSGVAYLSAAQQSQLVAALLFSVGFLTVLLFELHLFTDRIGYLFTGGGKLKKRLASILFVLLGNILGALATGALLHCVVGEQAAEMLSVTTALPIGEMLVRSIFCGMLMFISAHGYRRQNGGFAGFVLSIMAVGTVALCGFEHVIVDIFYASAALCFDNRTLVLIVISFFGNILGAIVFSALYALKKDDEKGGSHSSRRHHHHHEH